MAKVWMVCNVCGSRDVTRDAIVRWDEENQEWGFSSELDNTDCNNCSGEAHLDEVEIALDDTMRRKITKWGWTLEERGPCLVYLYVTGDPREIGPFDELADAYLYTLYHEPEIEEEEPKPTKIELSPEEREVLKVLVRTHDINDIDANEATYDPKALLSLKAKVLLP
jgi:hypothetical protein